MKREAALGAVLGGLAALVVGPGEGAEQRLLSARVAQGPAIDGDASDGAWTAAKETKTVAKGVFPQNSGKATEVTLRSVHTDTHVFVLVRFRDETRDDQAHKPWVWDAGKGAYVEGPEREDMFALAFEHTGPFTGDMLSPDEAVWDVWHWKATRTNPQGFAMDRSHRYTRQQWEGKGKSHTARNGEADLDRAARGCGRHGGEEAAGARKPGRGRRAAVPSRNAVGQRRRREGEGPMVRRWWTLELERKLDTGHPDDVAFDPKRTYRMAVSAHDRTGDMDKASPVLELGFGK